MGWHPYYPKLEPHKSKSSNMSRKRSLLCAAFMSYGNKTSHVGFSLVPYFGRDQLSRLGAEESTDTSIFPTKVMHQLGGSTLVCKFHVRVMKSHLKLG